MTAIWVVVSLLVASGLGVLVWWLSHGQQPAQVRSLPEAVDNAQTLRLQGKIDEAQKATNDAINKPGVSDNDKYLLYVQQGSGYADQKNFTAAIDSYTKAETIKPTYDIEALIADAWRQIGDKEKAITYYKKAISLIPADYVLAEGEKQAFEQTIRNLGGQP